MKDAHIPSTDQPRIVIIGGGFGGITLARKLRHQPYQVVLLDRNNYHTFQPLLYQVATGELEVDSIAYPLRKIVKRGQNLYFRLAEVQQIVPETQELHTSIGTIHYDYLVIATGSKPNFFNFAPVQNELFPLKTVPDALDLRSYLLENMESALLADTSDDQEERMNVVIVGGGPTGVELAGALAEMKKYVLPNDYPELNFDRMHLHLFEMEPKLLGMMSGPASRKSQQYLEEMGVLLHLNAQVKEYDGTRILFGEGASIRADTLLWTAGVQGNVVAGIDAAVDHSRVQVDACNRVKGYENIFALGDVAGLVDNHHPKGYPMLAPVAMQQAELLARNLTRNKKGEAWQAFHYVDKGTLATVGRNKAVADLPYVSFQGTLAWWTWMGVHLVLLAGFRNRFVTFIDWAWNYFSYDRALRLIIRPYRRADRKVSESVLNTDHS